MKQFLLQFFTWWNGQTLGTRFWTWRAGEFVGEDDYGNATIDRRTVTAAGSSITARPKPPAFHPAGTGRMHRRTDIPPTEDSYRPKQWEKPHLPNLTGTPAVYRPRGSILTAEKRQEVTGDYEPWVP